MCLVPQINSKCVAITSAMATIKMRWLGKQWLQLNFLFKRDELVPCGAGPTI
ncbi:unnamed protein product [Prunus brigantina]